MTNFEINNLWNSYIETTRYVGRPVKLDTVLEQRMKAFIKARELKLAHIQE